MTKHLAVGDCNVAVYDEGSGPTILFVHGFPLSHAMWRGQLENLKSRFRVVAPDLRGFGESPLPTGDGAEAMPGKLFAQITHNDKPEIVAEIRSTIAATHPQGLAAAQRGMAEREDVRTRLPQIAVPTLVIVGREDAISPVDEMRAIADAIPGANFHVVEQAGHMAPLEQPGEVNRLIADFVDSLT